MKHLNRSELTEISKDAIAAVIDEMHPGNIYGVDGIRKMLDNVNNADDLLGVNTLGRKEYDTFIAGKESGFDRAVKRNKKII